MLINLCFTLSSQVSMNVEILIIDTVLGSRAQSPLKGFQGPVSVLGLGAFNFSVNLLLTVSKIINVMDRLNKSVLAVFFVRYCNF